ncbi:MAG: LysM domain [Thermoleophilaceae bacterium]|jgi:LysM repeat protein|nr:LysM domain [Thermoleophilaceae bacterium]
MNGQSSGGLRMLAPIALVVVGIVFFIILTSSGGSGDDFSTQPVDFGAGQDKVKQPKKDKNPLGVDTTTEATVTDLTTETDTTSTDPLATDTTSTTLTPTPTKTNYVVKPGDTLEAISAKTGVSVDELTTLNPEIDPQALVAGSKLKLTE